MKIKSIKGTYKRKYYLHRQLKKQGFGLQLSDKNKTITVMPDLADFANGNKYVAELQIGFSYGVQFLNPIIQ